MNYKEFIMFLHYSDISENVWQENFLMFQHDPESLLQQAEGNRGGHHLLQCSDHSSACYSETESGMYEVINNGNV
jgi:hypothetical protein